ncbi:MAG: hypothetical protein ACHQF2_12325 [Flavobacteriales bacterium]
MKRMLICTAVLAATVLTSCGASEEEQNKKIEEAAEMRAKQVCEGDGSLDNYGQKLDWLSEQLQEDGIDEKGYDKATELFNEKIKSSCPDKMPK